MLSLKNPVFKFLTLTILLYFAWLLLFELIIKPWGHLDHVLSENISFFICNGLDLIGYQPHFSIAENLGETYIFLSSSTYPVIRVGASCNGLELLILFTIFICCYPGKWSHKVVFITAGLLVIHTLNIVRNIILTLMAIHHSPWFDLFHRYIFIFVVYGAIFLLWMWWANYQRKNSVIHE
jgi:exosortase family protein XrtF